MSDTISLDRARDSWTATGNADFNPLVSITSDASTQPGKMPVALRVESAFNTSKLAELEKIIHRGRETFCEVGNALAQIMDDQLYREKGFGSFGEYCEEVWGFKKTYAYQLVQSATVLKELSGPVSAIAEKFNPGQVRALIRVPKAEREAVIKTAVAKSRSAGRALTAKDIKIAASPEQEPITAHVMVEDVKIYCPRAKSKRDLDGWYVRAAKEKRGYFLNFIFSHGEVEVEDKVEFKRRVDSWLEHHVSEKGTRP